MSIALESGTGRPKFTFQYLAILAGLTFAVLHTWSKPWTVDRLIGAVLMGVGILLWILALRELGEAFTWRAQATRLVTTGLYAKIRNPIYIFRGVAIAGWFLFIGLPWFLLLAAIALPVQWIRARREAATLEQEFGDRYREYRRQTWF
jgi:protein-S-isoprenylcysteine O-methyltransferase Ste14